MKDSIQFAYSVQGYSHILANKVCQDSSGEYNDDQMSIIVLADGHGGNDYPRTDKGSEFAVKCAINNIKAFVLSVEHIDIYNYEQKLNDLARNILIEWHKCVNEDLSSHPLSETDLERVSQQYRARYTENICKFGSNAYGTTLIAACITPSYWFGMQIGDGKCVTFTQDGIANEPIRDDPKCRGNITTSICDEDAIEEFRFCFENEIPAAIFIGSDGVDDSYPNPSMIHQLYSSVLQICMEHGEEKMKSELKPYLSTISQKGSGDDISVCGWIEKTRYIISYKNYKLRPYLDRLQEKNKELNVHSYNIEKATEEKNKHIDICKKIKKKTNLLNNLNKKLQSLIVSDSKYNYYLGKINQFNEEIKKLENEKASLKIKEANNILEKKKEVTTEIKKLVGQYNNVRKSLK